MYTLLNSLAREGKSGASLDMVDNWINSHMFSQDDARKAFDQGFLLVKNIYSDNVDRALVGSFQKGTPYVFLTEKGFSELKTLNPHAVFGRPAWKPEIRLKKFIQKYDNSQK